MKIKINDTIIKIPFKLQQLIELLNNWGWKWEKHEDQDQEFKGKLTYVIAAKDQTQIVNGVKTTSWFFAFDNYMYGGNVIRITTGIINDEGKPIKQWIVKHGFFGYKLLWDKVKA